MDIRLDPTPAAPTNVVYQRVGRGRSQFLVKRLQGRPDYDHILTVTAKADASAKLSLVRRSVIPPSTASFEAESGGRMRDVQQIYLEFNDLA